VSRLSALVVVLRAESEASLIAEWRARFMRCPIVAVLPSLQATLVERVFAAGASGVVACCADPREFTEMVQAAIEGKTVLPCELVRQLAGKAEGTSALSLTERRWLKALAEGCTVCDLARRSAYSERQMHRRLGAVYARLGARGKTEALLRAERAGLLDG
jgi:DNA-binding NarL/FixJ family response regulator